MSKAVCTSCHFIFDSRIGVEELQIPPGTVFDEIDSSTFLCPHCGASHDQFIEVRDEILEPEDLSDLSEVEAEHLPYYLFENEDLVVKIGYPGSEHPQEIEHRIEWIELVDREGERIDRVYFRPEEVPEARFSIDEEEEFYVYASCSEHGIWKWIAYENLNL